MGYQLLIIELGKTLKMKLLLCMMIKILLIIILLKYIYNLIFFLILYNMKINLNKYENKIMNIYVKRKNKIQRRQITYNIKYHTILLSAF